MLEALISGQMKGAIEANQKPRSKSCEPVVHMFMDHILKSVVNAVVQMVLDRTYPTCIIK